MRRVSLIVLLMITILPSSCGPLVLLERDDSIKQRKSNTMRCQLCEHRRRRLCFGVAEQTAGYTSSSSVRSLFRIRILIIYLLGGLSCSNRMASPLQVERKRAMDVKNSFPNYLFHESHELFLAAVHQEYLHNSDMLHLF